eukprot:TRINITY_DN16699_c0_g1_i5.p1 TRINITY_DN16699_c0_g1~~TRINITY_DN16699_c0_g1_i5.p1  ORF type:complete len:915 (+),score=207.49 TRINITY_DN16699_c0_g1_i5:76-2820(+)
MPDSAAPTKLPSLPPLRVVSSRNAGAAGSVQLLVLPRRRGSVGTEDGAYTVDASLSWTIDDLKTAIEETSGLLASEQRLYMLGGRALRDDEVVGTALEGRINSIEFECTGVSPAAARLGVSDREPCRTGSIMGRLPPRPNVFLQDAPCPGKAERPDAIMYAETEASLALLHSREDPSGTVSPTPSGSTKSSQKAPTPEGSTSMPKTAPVSPLSIRHAPPGLAPPGLALPGLAPPALAPAGFGLGTADSKAVEALTDEKLGEFAERFSERLSWSLSELLSKQLSKEVSQHVEQLAQRVERQQEHMRDRQADHEVAALRDEMLCSHKQVLGRLDELVAWRRSSSKMRPAGSPTQCGDGSPQKRGLLRPSAGCPPPLSEIPRFQSCSAAAKCYDVGGGVGGASLAEAPLMDGCFRPSMASLEETRVNIDAAAVGSWTPSALGSPFANAVAQESPLSRRPSHKSAATSQQSQAPPGSLQAIVSGPIFDAVCATVIVANAITMAVSTQRSLTYAINYPGKVEEELDIFRMLTTCFCVFYMIELLLKLIAFRLEFFTNKDKVWNIFDFVLVLSGIWDLVWEYVDLGLNAEGAGMTFMRILRLGKMMKMLRVVRVMKVMRPLRMMLASILGSISTLMWSLLMMALIMYMFGLCFMHGCASYLSDKGGVVDDEVLEGIVKYWSSVHQSTITLFMAVTGGSDWEPLAEPLKAVGEIYYSLFLAYIAFFMIAVLNVLTGIFVDTAMKVGESDNNAVMQEIEQTAQDQIADLRELLEQADRKGTGMLQWQSIEANFKTKAVKAFLKALQMDKGDLRRVYGLLEAGCGVEKVSIDDYLSACCHFVEDPEHITLLMLMHGQSRLSTSVSQLLTSTSDRLDELFEMFQALCEDSHSLLADDFRPRQQEQGDRAKSLPVRGPVAEERRL